MQCGTPHWTICELWTLRRRERNPSSLLYGLALGDATPDGSSTNRSNWSHSNGVVSACPSAREKTLTLPYPPGAARIERNSQKAQ
jgi:hypothetical protein